jgi:uncharacterized protein YndB with AHSA1/START domain
MSAPEPHSDKHLTTAERTSACEHVVTRTFSSPARTVFAAWTTPELLTQWWAPKSFGIAFLSCAVDARTGGTYRFVFGHPAAAEPMAFFGRYLEVIPPTRLVWTNDESGESGAISTATFTEIDGTTRLVLHDRYPTKEALDAAIESGSTCGFGETFDQLDLLLAGQ